MTIISLAFMPIFKYSKIKLLEVVKKVIKYPVQCKHSYLILQNLFRYELYTLDTPK